MKDIRERFPDIEPGEERDFLAFVLCCHLLTVAKGRGQLVADLHIVTGANFGEAKPYIDAAKPFSAEEMTAGFASYLLTDPNNEGQDELPITMETFHRISSLLFDMSKEV